MIVPYFLVLKKYVVFWADQQSNLKTHVLRWLHLFRSPLDTSGCSCYRTPGCVSFISWNSHWLARTSESIELYVNRNHSLSIHSLKIHASLRFQTLKLKFETKVTLLDVLLKIFTSLKEWQALPIYFRATLAISLKVLLTLKPFLSLIC